MVIPVSTADFPQALGLARRVRGLGLSAETDVSGHGVGAGLKLAAKRAIPLALIVGEDERRAGCVTLRDLRTSSERKLRLEELDEALKGGLRV